MKQVLQQKNDHSKVYKQHLENYNNALKRNKHYLDEVNSEQLTERNTIASNLNQIANYLISSSPLSEVKSVFIRALISTTHYSNNPIVILIASNIPLTSNNMFTSCLSSLSTKGLNSSTTAIPCAHPQKS